MGLLALGCAGHAGKVKDFALFFHFCEAFLDCWQTCLFPPSPRCLVQRLLPYTQYAGSVIRRRGAVGTLRNCCFDYSELCLRWVGGGGGCLATCLQLGMAVSRASKCYEMFLFPDPPSHCGLGCSHDCQVAAGMLMGGCCCLSPLPRTPRVAAEWCGGPASFPPPPLGWSGGVPGG